MLKYERLIKLFVLSRVLICCVYNDTILAEVVVLCLQFESIFNILTQNLKFKLKIILY